MHLLCCWPELLGMVLAERLRLCFEIVFQVLPGRRIPASPQLTKWETYPEWMMIGATWPCPIHTLTPTKWFISYCKCYWHCTDIIAWSNPRQPNFIPTSATTNNIYNCQCHGKGWSYRRLWYFCRTSLASKQRFCFKQIDTTRPIHGGSTATNCSSTFPSVRASTVVI